jgi:hypothetical protein
MKIKVTLSDDTVHELTRFGLATQVAFERKYAVSMSVLVTDPHAEYLAFLAHAELLRQQKAGRLTGTAIPTPFDEFLEVVEIIGLDVTPQLAEDGETPNP